MKINKEICENCNMECWLFMGYGKSYLMCMNKDYFPNWPDSLQDCFSMCIRTTTRFIRHIGKIYRMDGDEQFGYGSTNERYYRNDMTEYKYDGWNPFKRWKAFRSKKKADSYWRILDKSEMNTTILPKNFSCPYEIEHMLSEWNKEKNDG